MRVLIIMAWRVHEYYISFIIYAANTFQLKLTLCFAKCKCSEETAHIHAGVMCPKGIICQYVNRNRNSIGLSRLSSLALIHIHYDIAVDLDKTVDLFSQMYSRKLELKNLLYN